MLVDLLQLRKLAEDKLITIQEHDELPLLIFNYTPLCQYERAWDEFTLMCRGLITDLEGNVVARPFRKFFNLEEHHGEDCKLPPLNWQQPFLVTEKMDGSLGILYPTPAGTRIATRGSFASDQAIRGTRIWREKYCQFEPVLLPNCTYLFEIIYPENRIVVDYKGLEDLVLLDVIDNSTGLSIGREPVVAESANLGCPVADAYDAFTAEHLINGVENEDKNREGLVVTFKDGSRIKIKLAEYKRLHRLVTGCSSRSIWENMKEGKDLAELLERVPDEFNAWVRKNVADIQTQFDAVRDRAVAALAEIKGRLGDASRKDYALEIMKHRSISSVLFHLLDGNDPAELVWKMIKPVSTKPFHQDIDA